MSAISKGSGFRIAFMNEFPFPVDESEGALLVVNGGMGINKKNDFTKIEYRFHYSQKLTVFSINPQAKIHRVNACTLVELKIGNEDTVACGALPPVFIALAIVCRGAALGGICPVGVSDENFAENRIAENICELSHPRSQIAGEPVASKRFEIGDGGFRGSFDPILISLDQLRFDIGKRFKLEIGL